MAKRKKTKKLLGGPRTFGRLQAAIDKVVQKEVRAAMKEAGGNVTLAAELLGVSRRSIWARMKSFEMDPNDFRK